MYINQRPNQEQDTCVPPRSVALCVMTQEQMSVVFCWYRFSTQKGGTVCLDPRTGSMMLYVLTQEQRSVVFCRYSGSNEKRDSLFVMTKTKDQ